MPRDPWRALGAWSPARGTRTSATWLSSQGKAMCKRNENSGPQPQILCDSEIPPNTPPALRTPGQQHK
eukprot:7126344-Alexandrium_andersonii.AAC.1